MSFGNNDTMSSSSVPAPSAVTDNLAASVVWDAVRVPLYFTQPSPDTTRFSVSETGSPLAVRSDTDNGVPAVAVVRAKTEKS